METYNSIEVTRQLVKDGKISQEIAETIFPQLKENEDERIRNFLIGKFREIGEVWHEYSTKDIISWLEKQGSQNLANSAKTCKDEPKFNVGDFVLHGKKNIIFQVEKTFLDKTYRIVPVNADMGKAVTSTTEDTLRLWTIQDAKDGDVLSFNDGHGNDSIELIKSITDKKIEFWFCLTNGNRYEVFDGITPYTNLVSREDATPATKEQCDQLEKAMADAGYRWNPNEKKMEKIEQNPAWSEEDEDNLYHINALIKDSSLEVRRQEFLSGWLKSLKDRLQPQQKPAWSNEDEKMIEFWNLYYEHQVGDMPNKDVVENLEKFRDWLKALKERYTWKPSDEQMKQLHKYCPDNRPLTQLYQDLKKLREE